LLQVAIDFAGNLRFEILSDDSFYSHLTHELDGFGHLVLRGKAEFNAAHSVADELS
jgi:hypothetical protein